MATPSSLAGVCYLLGDWMRDTALQAENSGLWQKLRSSARALRVSTSPWSRYSSSVSSRGGVGPSLELCTFLPGGKHQLLPTWMGWDLQAGTPEQDPRAGTLRTEPLGQDHLPGQDPWSRNSKAR